MRWVTRLGLAIAAATFALPALADRMMQKSTQPHRKPASRPYASRKKTKLPPARGSNTATSE